MPRIDRNVDDNLALTELVREELSAFLVTNKQADPAVKQLIRDIEPKIVALVARLVEMEENQRQSVGIEKLKQLGKAQAAAMLETKRKARGRPA